MVQGLVNCDVGKRFLWSMQKRTTRRREPYTSYFIHPAAAQTLVNRIVFAVDRKQGLVLAAGFGSDQFSGGNKAFLIRQTHGLAGADSFVSRLKTGNPYDRAHHEVGFRMRCDSNI